MLPTSPCTNTNTKTNTSTPRMNKNSQLSPLFYGTDGKLSEQMTTISQRSDMGEQPQVHFQDGEEQVQQQMNELKLKLAKQQQKNFILTHFFKKIQKVLYSESSELMSQGEIKDYQQLQIHLQDMVKRVQKGSHYSKLAAVPVIYKKNNTVTKMTVLSTTTKK